MKRLFKLLALGALIFLAACTTGNPQTSLGTPTVLSIPTAPVPSLTPTPQGIPRGSVLYQSNWSRGLAVWKASAGWKIVNGLPQSDFSRQNTLTLPYKLAIANYAVEFRFQIVGFPQNGGSFVLSAKRTQDKNGYVAGILGMLDAAPHSEFANPQIQVYLDPEDAIDSPESAYPSDYEPGNIWHTFRVEVQGPQVNLLTDGTSKGVATSKETDWLSNGPLQLISSQVVVRLSSVRVVAL